MPLIKYFGFVGTALYLSLIAIGWCFPQSASESIAGAKERPTIRINSAERLPERVVIDTTAPTIVPLPNTRYAESGSAAVVETVRPQPKTFAELATASPGTPQASGDALKTKHIGKREAAKKVGAHRTAQPLIIAPAPNQIVQSATPNTRMSLLETLKERLGQLPQLLEAQAH